MKKLLSITIVLIMLLGLIPTVVAEETKTYKVRFFQYDEYDSLYQLDYINFSNTTTEIREGESYITKLSPKTNTIEIDTLVVVMGENTPVFPTKNNDGSYLINIPKVNGDICIAVSIRDIGLAMEGGNGYNYYITNLSHVSSQYCNELKENNPEIVTTQVKPCAVCFFGDVFTPDEGYEIVDFKIAISDNFNEERRDITTQDGVITKNADGSYKISVFGTVSMYITAVAEPIGSSTTTQPPTYVSGQEYTNGDYKYKILDDGTASITGYLGKSNDIVIPSEIDGYKVTTVGCKAIRAVRYLNSIVFPDSIVTIERGALGKCTFDTVTLGKNVRYLGIRPLDGARGKNIVVSKENKYFASKNGVLFNKKMTKLLCYPQYKSDSSYNIPKGVKRIGSNAFAFSNYLKNIHFPKTLKTIESYAFHFCNKLKKINIPVNVVSIEKSAFTNCGNVKKLTITPNKKLKIGERAFSYIGVKSLTVPKVTGKAVFANCSNLKSIKISSKVKTIKDYEFFECRSLKTVTIPKTVTKIGKYSLGYEEEYNTGDNIKIEGFTIKGKKGSAAQRYAKRNGFKFIAI